MKNKTIVIFLAAVLAMASLTACGSSKDPSYLVPTSSTEGGNASQGSDSASQGTTAPVESTTSAASSIGADVYSKGFTDEGFIAGVTASDYVTLPDFNTMPVKMSDIAPSSTYVEYFITSFMNQFTVYDETSAVQMNDKVNIDYVGYVDGEAFEGGDTQGVGTTVTIGVTQYIDDFLEQLIGHTPGETINVEVTFPDPYSSNTALSGKDAVFVTTINYIEFTPEFTEEFIAEHQTETDNMFGEGITTPDEARDRVFDYLLDNALLSAVDDILQDSLDSFNAPAEAVAVAENQLDINIQLNYGMTLKQYAKEAGYTETQLEVLIDDEAKALMAYQAVAEQEGWVYDEAKLREKYGESYETLVPTYGKGYLAQFLIYQDAGEFLKNSIVIINDLTEE